MTIVRAPLLRCAFGYERVLWESTVEQYAATARMRLRLAACAWRGAPPARRRVGRVAWCPTHPAVGAGPVTQLGANAFGEVLEPGRVPDCYLGLVLEPPSGEHAGRVLVVGPATLLHAVVPQPTAPCCTSC